ncbi:YdiK family protein [Niallia sp. XMNu-256]|uniref:YdiK family protein n=1 Tax=Niallia sp. XMNu-256 TaxID=3082444 RepID=UPI0030D2B9E5
MRQTPLFSGIIYVVLGIIFTLFAIQNVNTDGEWGFFSILLVILATFDFGSGFRLIRAHFRMKKQKNEP